jgi:hypothetical protein
MPNRKLYTSFIVFIAFVAIFVYKQNFTDELYQDEFHYLPTAAFFSKEPIPSLNLLKSYNELNTPLPFILGGWVVNSFGENIQYLRLLTFVVSFSLLMVFIWFSPNNSPRFFLCLGGLVAFPNYYLCSVYYYTDIYAMFSVLCGTVAYLKKKHAVAALFFIIAVSCRQYMLAFPAAILAFELLHPLKNRRVAYFLKNLLSDKTWIFYAVALLSIIPWLLLWNGPAPASVMAEQYYDSDKLINYNFGYVIYSASCLAAYYVIPEVLFTRKYNYFIHYPRLYPWSFLSFLLIIATLITLFPAKQAYNPYFTWPYLGYLDQLLMTVGITGIMKQICFGLLMLITLMRFISPHFNLASCFVITNLLLLGKAQLSWDKYSLPMIMALWFLAMFDSQWSLSSNKTGDLPLTPEIKQ